MGIPAGQEAAQHRRIIDASVHVFFESNGDLRSYMQEPFKSRGIPTSSTCPPPFPRWPGRRGLSRKGALPMLPPCAIPSGR